MVTVAVPVYNSIDFLDQCVAGILAQTYTDWELILVDDGSTDGSSELCDKLALSDKRIRVIHQPNQGAAVARNNAIKEAKGQWLTFVDSDDLIMPEYIADLAENSCNCDVVIAGWQKNDVVTKLTPIHIDAADFGKHLFGKTNYGYILSKLYSIDMLRNNNIEFDKGVVWAEDALFFDRVTLFARAINITDGVYYKYVVHTSSMVNRIHSFDKEIVGFEAAKQLTPLMIDRFREHNNLSPYAFLWRAIYALYRDCDDPKKRLDILRNIEFDRKIMRNRPQNFKESIITWLVINRHWRLLELALKR